MKGFPEINLGKDGTASDVLDVVSDMGEGVVIQDGPVVELSVIPNDPEASRRLGYKVYRAGPGLRLTRINFLHDP